MIIAVHPNPLVMEILTDPVELERSRVRQERFRRNLAHHQQRIEEIAASNRGKYFCVAGQEFFLADSGQQARALAQAAHPEDDGWFTGYIPRERMARIYANRRRVAPGR